MVENFYWSELIQNVLKLIQYENLGVEKRNFWVGIDSEGLKRFQNENLKIEFFPVIIFLLGLNLFSAKGVKKWQSKIKIFFRSKIY